MKLSVVIPVYNESKTILSILERVLTEKTPKEVIIVDDCSTDGTWEKLQSLKPTQKIIKLLRNEVNQGKGAAVRKGIKQATGDVLLIQDADLEYDPNDFARLISPIKEGVTEVVYGSRLKDLRFILFGKNRTPLPWHYIANRVLSFLTNVLYGINLTDMETCYKVMTKKVYKSLVLVSKRFEIEVEITAKIAKKGYQIIEIPISTKPRGYKEGKKIKSKDALIAMWALIKYRYS